MGLTVRRWRPSDATGRYFGEDVLLLSQKQGLALLLYTCAGTVRIMNPTIFAIFVVILLYLFAMGAHYC